MLIPITKPNEEFIYAECQQLKDIYKDGAIVGLYASYYLDDRWVLHLGKTIFKNGKVETIDSCIIHCDGDIAWTDVNKKFSEYLGDVKCVINYGEHCVFDSPEYNLENLDVEVMAMHCQYYFYHRGLDVSNIEYIRCMFEYGEGIEGINLYTELVELLDDILIGYEVISEQNEEKNKS